MAETETRESRIKYPGIIEHARQLGVSRVHLWKVLSGRRESQRLMERYRALVAREEATTKAGTA